DAYNAHGADAIFLVLGNRGLESIEPNLKVRVGREGAQRIAAETDAIDSFIDRDVALLGCVHGPTIVDSVVLAVVAGDGVAPEFECDEVRHHAAAGEIAAGVFAVAAEVGEPAYYPPLHGNRRRADGICAYVLIDGRTDEVGDNTHGIRRRSDEPHVAGMADIGAIGKQFVLEFIQHGVWRTWLLRQRLHEKPVRHAWFDVRKYALLFDVV